MNTDTQIENEIMDTILLDIISNDFLTKTDNTHIDMIINNIEFDTDIMSEYELNKLLTYISKNDLNKVKQFYFRNKFYTKFANLNL